VKPPVLLVDASIYIFRSYFSMPDHWRSRCGSSTNAVYGYSHFLLRLLESCPTEYIACCYDESLTQCFRNAIYPEYKANRVLPDDALAFQLKACREASEAMGLPSFASAQYEADDLIGSLMTWANRQPELAESAIAIVTRDKDLAQLLLRDIDFLWNFAEDNRVYRNDILQRFGVFPEQLVDYLALVGDKIDNIPGVPGIGAKSAATLLSNYESLEALFENLDNLHNLPLRGAKSFGKKLEQHSEQIAIAKMLATIACDVPLAIDENLLSRKAPDQILLQDFFDKMGFPGAFARAKQVLVTA